MFNQIINYYKSATQKLITHQNISLNLLPQKYFSDFNFNNISHDFIQQHVTLANTYWHNQQIDKWLETINQLDKLAQDYPQYQRRILEFISGFVRHHAPYIFPAEADNSLTLPMRTAIQTILTMIAKTHRQNSSENEQLDLSYTDIRGANLPGANLELANLYHVNLAGANLSQANLSGAILTAANLLGANLSGANLSGAILSAANLSEANLAGADLTKANLYLANLNQTILDDARLDGANLRDVKLGVTETLPLSK